ncbi:MAG: sigma-70 family RNA polymerase sigma factor [Clostridia bacterium]|nr:sigma-70 family RNA polymerase sigma factor [Clostridia bacterium]
MDRGEELYRRYLNGEEDVFDRIMEEYRYRLIFFIHEIVHDLDAAEDVAMDVFCYLLMHPKRYRFGTKFSTYLFMLAKSRAIDYIRHRNRFQWVSTEEKEADLADEKTLEEAVLENEIKRTIHKALSDLPEAMRQVVHLVYFENRSYKDTALIMKKSPKQIDNLLFRAKEKMRDILGKEGEDLL